MTPFSTHVECWKDCRRCGLCDQRRNIVLARGQVPCDVLFIGEAPGTSEDVLAQPFVSPAGHKLDDMVRRAGFTPPLRWAFTNLVACFPREAKNTGNHAPQESEIKACTIRLKEFVELCRPQMLVCVGELAWNWVPRLLASPSGGIVKIVHPAAILRANPAHKGLMEQRAIVTLAKAREGLCQK